MFELRVDLVVVPPKSYMEDAWIGEIASNSYTVESVKVARLFGDEVLAGRSALAVQVLCLDHNGPA